jgi:CheY-like chemotaxis protein
VRLVADITSEIEVDTDPKALLAGLTELLETLIGGVGHGTSLSLVTGLEAAPDGAGMGRLRIEVSAPSLPAALTSAASAAVRRHLPDQEITLATSAAATSTAVTISVPRACMTIGLIQDRTAVVVDDDVDTQEYVAEVLRAEGYRVITVNDGFDALLVIERHKPDVVLTDILMPNMSGIDLVARIKRVRADLPVVVFSGYREALLRNVAGLPDKILPKPMTRADILAALRAVTPART